MAIILLLLLLLLVISKLLTVGAAVVLTSTVVAIILCGTFWDKIRERVAAWLRSQGWQNGLIMDAWIKLDLVVGGIRGQIFVKTKRNGYPIKISEEVWKPEDIDDREVQDELRKRGYAERNIMTIVH